MTEQTNPYLSRPWQAQYPESCPQEIKLPHDNLVQLYENCATRFADKTCYTSFDVHVSYRQAYQWAQKIATWLQQNLPIGSHIAIMSPNCLAYPILLQAIHMAGMVVGQPQPIANATRTQFYPQRQSS